MKGQKGFGGYACCFLMYDVQRRVYQCLAYKKVYPERGLIDVYSRDVWRCRGVGHSCCGTFLRVTRGLVNRIV